MNDHATVQLPEILETLVATIELRDSYTKGHSKRVAHYARFLANEVGLDEASGEAIFWAGVVHDIGKIGIPDAVLLKPGRLTPDEYETIKYHSLLSALIIEPIEALRPLVPIVRHHHERIDGRGYPDGIGGEEIPLGARILAVADIYDALTSSRVYRAGMSHAQAAALLDQMAKEGHTDAALTALFLARVPGFVPPNEPEKLSLKPLELARNTFFYRDPLTRLLNRDALIALVKKGLSSGQPMTLLGVDIVGFKEINLRFGLAHGDQCLQKIGALLANYARLDETLSIAPEEIKAFRTSADRFYLLYHGLAVDFFEYKVASLRQKIEKATGLHLRQRTIFSGLNPQGAAIEWGALL